VGLVRRYHTLSLRPRRWCSRIHIYSLGSLHACLFPRHYIQLCALMGSVLGQSIRIQMDWWNTSVGILKVISQISEPKRPVRPSPRAGGTDGYLGVRPDGRPGWTSGDRRCLKSRNLPGPSRRRATGPTGNGLGLQVTGGDCRYRRGLPIGRGLQGPTVTLLSGSLSQRTGALALQPETHAPDARDWSPIGAYRADGTLGITDLSKMSQPLF